MAKTVSDWVAKGWTRLDLTADGPADVIYDPATQDLVLKGQKFGPDGQQLKGKDRPYLTSDETESGCTITSSDDTTVLYKIVGQEADEEA